MREFCELIKKDYTPKQMIDELNLNNQSIYYRFKKVKQVFKLNNWRDLKNLDMNYIYDVVAEHESSKLTAHDLPFFGRNDSLKVLSRKERIIVMYLVNNYKSNDIATKCSIGVGTVKFHCGRIYKKLKVKNKTDLIIKYLKGEIKITDMYIEGINNEATRAG